MVMIKSFLVALQVVVVMMMMMSLPLPSCHAAFSGHSTSLRTTSTSDITVTPTRTRTRTCSSIYRYGTRYRHTVIQTRQYNSFEHSDGVSTNPSSESEPSTTTTTTTAAATTTTTTTPDALWQSYRLAQYGYTIAAVLMWLTPNRTNNLFLLSTQWGSAMGFAMAARLSSILRTAHTEHRLASDTYKRLNIGLLGFNTIGILAIPGEAAMMVQRRLPFKIVPLLLLSLVRVWGWWTAWHGWSSVIPKSIHRSNCNTTTTTTTSRTIDLERIMSHVRDPLMELVRGTKETVLGLRVRSAKKALTYRNCLLIICAGIISHFMEGLFHLRYRHEFARTWLDVTLQWSTVLRLFMIATMMYSLKDAAERDRLTGTTFIELNIMIGAWALLVGLGQAIYPLGFAAYRGVEMYAFAIPFWLKAYKSQKEKVGQVKVK